MEFTGGIARVQPFVTLTLAIIVLFVGKSLNQRIHALRASKISESVSGGLLFALLITGVYIALGIEVQFDISARKFLLVYFFSAIGINTLWREVLSFRRTLAVLLAATVGYMLLQDLIALSLAQVLGSAGPTALLAGTIALAGGPDTVAAWAPKLVDDYGILDAQYIGLASATLGLILGSIVGGPIAAHLIHRHGLHAGTSVAGEAQRDGEGVGGSVVFFVFLRSILAINVCVIAGLAIEQLLIAAGLTLPLPVVCFLVAIALTNIIPSVLPAIDWPRRTPAMSLIAELCLGILFGMSLISAQLWLIMDLPTGLLLVVLVQAIATAAITMLIVFRLLGQDHDAAVICAGFAGFGLGSTATGMANMKAVAKGTGSLHMAFIIVPMVAVLCTEAFNGIIIRVCLSWF